MFRILLGVMESANWPGAMRMVALRFPPSERALANGVFTSGTSVGAVLAPGVVLALAAAAGWRSPFFIVGLIGFLWVAAWIPFALRYPLVERVAASAADGPRRNVYAAALRSVRFWRVFVIAICVNPPLYFFLNWLPTYLSQQKGIAAGVAMAGMLTAVYLALDAGNLSAGAMIYLLLKIGKSMRSARRIVFCLASLFAMSAVAIHGSRDSAVSLALMCSVTFALGIWISMYLTLAQEVDPANVSTVAGLLGGSGALAGAIAMWAVGRVTVRTGSFAAPLAAVSTACVIAAIAGWTVAAPERDA